MINWLACKPDLEESIERVDAWLNGKKVDRPPVRFARHNEEYISRNIDNTRWPSMKERWFDTGFQLDMFEESLRNKIFHGETFPVFWPNLGPNVFAACYGCPYEFGDVTAWAEPGLFEDRPHHPDLKMADGLPQIDWDSEYIRKLDSMTALALERAQGKYLVGYTDMHPGLDMVAAMRGTQQALFDVYDDPDLIVKLSTHFHQDFIKFYNRYHDMLMKADQYSVTWMNIPAKGKLHIPSCDFSAMISPDQFRELAWDGLAAETAAMDFNIFHLDGPGVARQIDSILKLPKINAIQWVQGMGEDTPIMQWIPFIKKMQDSGKGVIVDLALSELDGFMAKMDPHGIFLCVSTADEAQELEVIRKISKW